MQVLMGGIGLLSLLLIAYLLSTNRRAVRWRPVIGGIVIQLVFAVLILKTPWGLMLFRKAGELVTTFLNFSDEGSKFIFGEEFGHHFFAFKVLTTIVFFSSIMAVGYHVGVMQWFVRIFARLMEKTMKTSGAESLSAASNIFVGQTEAPLLIRPFIGKMTDSELMAVMTGGFATVSGGVMAAYISFGVNAGHLIAASVMSAPAALAIAKLMVPETSEPQTSGNVSVPITKISANVVDAAAKGASDGMKLAINVAAMVLAFIAVIAFLNALLGWGGSHVGLPQISLEYILGWICWPIAFFIGIPMEECHVIGGLIGTKVVVNELIAYKDLGLMVKEGVLSARSEMMATYALCGFSNLMSIGIQIGGIGAIAPERRSDLARIGVRAMVAGNLACFMTANIAGILL